MMESAPFNYRRIVIWLGRIVLGILFVYAGYSKIFYPTRMFWPLPLLKFSISANLSNFGFQVESYKLLSATGVSLVAHTLPFAEIILGLLLLIGWRLRIWATIITLIMLGFLTVVTRAYLLHMDINCGCFAIAEKVTLKKVLEDAALALLAVLMTTFAFWEARKPHPWSAPAEAERA
jgi:uncharacterized membrane protein YphA (DoxX/SURF4 family)